MTRRFLVALLAGLLGSGSAAEAARRRGSVWREDHFGTRRNYPRERYLRLPRVGRGRPPLVPYDGRRGGY